MAANLFALSPLGRIDSILDYRNEQKRKKPQVIFFGRNSEASNRVLNTLALRENVDSLKCSINFTHKPNQFMAVLAKVDVSKGPDGTTEDEDDE